MEISAKNQIKGKITSVIHGTSYSQVAVEQTDADGNETGSFIHAAVPVDICKKMEMQKGNIVTCIFPAATVIIAKH
jgi:molybdopterin-binding protein